MQGQRAYPQQGKVDVNKSEFLYGFFLALHCNGESIQGKG